MDADVREEINRVRDRLHKLEGFAASQSARTRELRAGLAVLSDRVDVLEEVAHKLVNEDAIAERVAERVSERDAARFTSLQIWGIRAAIVGAIASPIITVLASTGVIA